MTRIEKESQEVLDAFCDGASIGINESTAEAVYNKFYSLYCLLYLKWAFEFMLTCMFFVFLFLNIWSTKSQVELTYVIKCMTTASLFVVAKKFRVATNSVKASDASRIAARLIESNQVYFTFYEEEPEDGRNQNELQR